MAVDIQSEEGRIIRNLIPLATWPARRFASLCAKLDIQTADDKAILFKRGDNDGALYYLLNGTVSLEVDALKIETIQAGSESARFALAHQIPRKVDGIANGKIQFLRVDASMINSVDETARDENETDMIEEDVAVEEEESDDWMTTLLKSPIFRGLPPANLQKILMSLEEIEIKAGDVIIRQGETGDYYYIIKKGLVMLSRKPSPLAKEIKLGQLGDLETFGEDSLISGDPRSVTITAITDTILFRLGKDQFVSLIKQPTLKYVNYQETLDYLDKGANLIDVRGPDEFKKSHLPHSINVPIFSLRMYLKTLNRHQPIIVICKNGKASETAAFILLRNKFNALILRDGIEGLSAEQLKMPASFAIDDGVETTNFTVATQEYKADTEIVEPAPPVQPANTDLRQAIQQLTGKYKNLEAEKMALELKCASLTRQLETLKAELERLKSAG